MQLSLFPILGLIPLSLAAPSAGAGSWSAAYAKASAAVAKLNITEKVGIVTGVGWQKGNCVGNTSPAPSIGYRAPCLMDSPLGVRYAQGVTAFPAGIQAASTWDRTLINERGTAMGQEVRGLGVNVLLGPVCGPLGKNARGGRNWEGFSPDPYLAGIAMQETINGIQGAGGQACAKHYIGNEQELNRGSMSANIGDRTLHELYLWPFADAVKANVASVMCSYNKVNGTYSCENKHTMTEVLKGELGFKGYIMSDWNAQTTTINSANSGLDMSMPGDDYSGIPSHIYWGPKLVASVENGSVPESRLNNMAERILASWYYVGQDKNYPLDTFDAWNNGTGGPDVQDDHKVVARAIARDGIVLLKNDDKVLPLHKPKSLAIVGYDAITNPDGPNACTDRNCDNGTLAMGWGSGTDQFPYLVSPLDAIQAQASKDNTKLVLSTSNDVSAGGNAAKQADMALVFINADSGEGYITVEGNAGDRNDLNPWNNGNELVAAVAAVNKKTIVVIHSVGPLILESILSNKNVVGIVWAGIPGQETGNGLADVLHGSTSPSGKLPYTIAKQPSDYGTDIVPGDDNYPEGLYIDYRHFDKAGITPRYEFGFGLSYTSFSFSRLSVRSSATSGPTHGSTAPGGPSDLYSTVATVTAQVKNTGKVTGAEVAQLYIDLPSSAPDHPPKQLRGFDKLQLRPGQTGTATYELRKKDLSYWDVASQKWVVPKGTFKVYIGASSRNIKLTGSLTVH
ncbi:beta-D-glucoside glucohydrolase [Rhizodiscina lignyota]|uniref:beta-glucosidase n=1 Tax=Rhizodiscina lignyota TaxID=1504668 RepID=A0A9P4IBN1_9PEZI|nr:beta-D-glucoside glucohydrolase [Rhizodiscina lignyota]